LSDFDEDVIAEFRANGGQVGPVEGMPILLLHHMGAESGVEGVAPVGYVEDRGRYVIAASTAWYDDLKAHPEITIEVGTEAMSARAEELEGAERDRLYAKLAAPRPQFPDYEANRVGVIAITPIEVIAQWDAIDGST
jgi:deazaflavin-dependent oxidoreductase (nitroreductase family)